MKQPAKYVAEITQVKEITLLGSADLAFWKDHLSKENLLPADCDGKAQVVISAIDAKYMGVRFREFCVSVYACRHEGAVQPDGFYLAQAFHSSRVLALIERLWFSTPYSHGQIDVTLTPCPAIRLYDGNDPAFVAQMTADDSTSKRALMRSGDECWEGPIFLPSGARSANPRRNVFFARLAGVLHAYPFDPAADVLTLKPSPGMPVLQWLVDSRFIGKEWTIRESATHARSKTYKREMAISG